MGNATQARELYLVNRTPQNKLNLEKVDFLVFGIGSIRGLALMSAYLELLAHRPDLPWTLHGVAGVSAGALMALAVALRLSPEEVAAFPQKTLLHDLGRSLKLQKTCKRWSIVDVTPLRDALEATVKKKLGTNRFLFADVDLDMRVFAYDIETMRLVEFSRRKTPTFSVVDAVVASCSMPFVFAPLSASRMCLVDGGVEEQFPFRVFPVRTTLGLYLFDQHRNSKTADDFFRSLSLEEKDHIIAIDVSKMGALELNPSKELLTWIQAQGAQSVRRYFGWPEKNTRATPRSLT